MKLETPEPQDKIKSHVKLEEPIRATLVSPSGRIPVTKVHVVRPPAERKPLVNDAKKREQREKETRRCFLANA